MASDGILISYPSDIRPPSCPDEPDERGLFQCERPVSTVLCIHEQESALFHEQEGTSSSGGSFIGMLPAIYIAAGGLIFAFGALATWLFIRCGNFGDGFERQLSTESTKSVRDVRKT